MMSPTTSSSSLRKSDGDEITTPVLEPDYDDTHLDLTPHYPPNDSPLRAESSSTSTSYGIESTKNSPIVIQQHHHHHHQQPIDIAATIDSIIYDMGKYKISDTLKMEEERLKGLDANTRKQMKWDEQLRAQCGFLT